ncbi:hypothetical protein JCM24511_00105 [Saitozyma sp. JCM 24511]|nr:hypothetical protein JCM24511_00105 [Saitozyma sp. JCM 24511]
MITRSQNRLTPPSTRAASASSSALIPYVSSTDGVYQRLAGKFAVCSLAELYGFESEVLTWKEFPSVFRDQVMERSKIENYLGKAWTRFFTERIEATLPKHERSHVSSMSEAHLLATQRCAMYLVDSQIPSCTQATSDGARRTYWKPVLGSEELLSTMESHQAALTQAQLYSVEGFFLDRCWKRLKEMSSGDEEMSEALRTLLEAPRRDEADTTESEG